MKQIVTLFCAALISAPFAFAEGNSSKEIATPVAEKCPEKCEKEKCDKEKCDKEEGTLLAEKCKKCDKDKEKEEKKEGTLIAHCGKCEKKKCDKEKCDKEKKEEGTFA